MHLLLLLVVQLQLTLVSTFASIHAPSPTSGSKNKNEIQVSIVKTNDDILSLADLRYQEWMSEDPNPPKLSSFRLATAEIYHERKDEREGGSTVFLATMLDNNISDNRHTAPVPVGAAELSPIELRGVFNSNDDNKLANDLREAMPLYITDVVTSSAHRRLGIGSNLMNAVETTARELGSRFVFLHVEHVNIGAMQFYKRLGYAEVVDATDGMISFNLGDGGLSKGNLIDMDVERIAVNAGTVGQLLMFKHLLSPTGKEVSSTAQSSSAKDSSASARGGFGNRKVNQKKKKRKR